MTTSSFRFFRPFSSAWALTLAVSSLAHAQETSQATESSPPASPVVTEDVSAKDTVETESPAATATSSDGDVRPEDDAISVKVPEKPVETEAQIDPYKEAKERVKRARKLYDAKNFDAALTEFQRAYDTMLGHPARPNVLYNIGRCQEGLYRYGDAIASYRLYLNEAGQDAPDRVKVQTTIESLEGFLGTIRLQVTAKKGSLPDDYEVWVDARLVGEGVASFLVPGGNHTVEIRAEGFESASKEVQLPARSEKIVAMELSPLAQEYKGLAPTYFWTAGGIALAAGVAGGVFGVMTMSKRSSLDNMKSEAVTRKDVDALESKALVADIFFIGAGVFATSATILAFLTDWSEPVDEDSPVQMKQVGLVPLTNGAAVSLRGSF